MQVGDDDRRAGQRRAVGQQVVRRGALLVDALHDRLQRRVARLDQVAGPVAVGRQPVRQGDDQRVPARPQPELERGHVEQHGVTDDRRADQRRVGERRHLRPVRQRRGHLERARPAAADPGDDTPAPPDHGLLRTGAG